MSILSRKTCRRCGNSYLPFLPRCPKCGARNRAAAERTAAPSSEKIQGTGAHERAGATARWQTVSAVVILACVILAVTALVSLEINKRENPAPSPTPSFVPTATPAPTPTATPVPTVTVESITVTFLGEDKKAGFTLRMTSPVQLGATTFPVSVSGELTIIWASTNEAVFTVDQTGLCTPVAQGSAELVASCGGAEARIPVIVRN